MAITSKYLPKIITAKDVFFLDIDALAMSVDN
jgi:hypothetical protein